jgi:hypothetical protein
MEMAMSCRNAPPKWWQVYLNFPLLIALFVLDSRLKVSTRGHQIVQIGIILLVYGLIHWWLKANRSALSKEDREQPVKIYKVIEIPPAESPALSNGRRSILNIPNSEIQGLLGDGMEISYTDPEVFSYQELHKN